MRYFNTSGPAVADEHYSIPPLDRVDLDEILRLPNRKRYCVLHAPRQTGKTSALLALQDLLNGGTAGDYRCVYVNFERGQTAREDVLRGMQAILDVIARRAESALGDNFVRKTWSQILDKSGPDGALGDVLQQWAEASPRPLVLLIDEADALVGDTFLAVLSQLRSNYDLRPKSFPHSIVLCGVPGVRDYSVHSRSEDRTIAGGSAFNINAKSLRLRDFTWDEVAALLNQHTTETGQRFEAEAHELVWSESRGQPWLVNALCDQACDEAETATAPYPRTTS